MRPPENENSSRDVLRRVAPGIKLIVALVLITVTALLPRRPDILYLIPAGLLAVIWMVSRMPLSYTLRRMVVVEFFIIGFGLLSLLVPGSRPIFLATLIKSNLCVFAMLLLTWTTPFHDILRELRRLRFPTVMLTTLALMYRYLPVLAEESGRMQRARASRTFSSARGLAWRNLTAIIGQLFIRSAERAERIYLAMCARGWK
jgi:cobalt/nickel transport system permease protein